MKKIVTALFLLLAASSAYATFEGNPILTKNGGTDTSSFTSGALLQGNGAGPVQSFVGTAAGQVPTWNGSAWSASPIPSPSSSGANTALSNLGATSINQSLLPSSNQSLGSSTTPWNGLYVQTASIGVTNGRSFLTIPGGISTFVPMVISPSPSPSLISTPVSGAIETDSTSLFYTANSVTDLNGTVLLLPRRTITGYLPFSVSSLTGTPVVAAGYANSGIRPLLMTAIASSYTCSTSPVFSIQDCGTSTTCASPTTLSSVTINAVNTFAHNTTAFGPTVAIGQGHYWMIKVTTGTCTTLSAAGSVEY
jgi:hypothetical protein